jgi:hypothetical protein
MKNLFIENELYYLSLSGAFQRNNVYSKEIILLEDNEKKRFKQSLKESVIEIAKQYNEEVDDDAHISSILKLIQINQSSILRNNGKLNFGTAQKLLNLYLKYLWCTERLSYAPPHCPIDSIILNKSLSFRNDRWTNLDCPQTYMQYVIELREIATKNKMSLAEWELMVFNRRN